MAWQAAGARDLDDILTFLAPREWECIAITSRLLSRETTPDHVLLSREEGERSPILECLLATEQGLIVPVFERGHRLTERRRARLRELISSRARRIHSVMGVRSSVVSVEAILAPKEFERIDYFIMSRDEPSAAPPAPLPAGMTIRRAGIVDLTSIFPLQRSYEREEVLLDPATFNATSSLFHLQKSLRREITLVAELDGKIVAKAATNAQGVAYDQIGGVFTLPELRNRGIAHLLLGTLLWEISRRSKRACLFVKKHNDPAIRLYRDLGFEVREDFSISYFRV